MIRLLPTAISGSRYVYLLEFSCGRAPRRYSSGSDVFIDVGDGTGEHRWVGGATIGQYQEQLDLFSSSSRFPSTSVSLPTDADFDPASLAASGYRLAHTAIKMWICYPDGPGPIVTRLLLNGVIVSPTYGAVGEPCSFAIEPDTMQGALFPPDAASVTPITWPDEFWDENIVGQTYPWIFGWPNSVQQVWHGAITFGCGSPALNVDGVSAGADWLVIAGHPVEQTTVYIFNVGNAGANFSASVATGSDGAGRTISYVDYTGESVSEGDELWVGWDATDGGGLTNPYGTGCLNRAGDVIRYLYGVVSVPLDTDYLDELAWFGVDCFINTQVHPPDWIRDMILPWLPASTTYGPDGTRIIPWRYRTDTPRTTLTAKRNAWRVSQLTVASDTVINDIRVNFALNPQSGGYVLYRRLAGENVEADEYTAISAIAIKSQETYGIRAASYNIDTTCSTTTAGLVLDYLIHRYAFPATTVSYQVAADQFEWLDLGDVIAVTDTDLHFDAKIAHITGKVYDGVALTLQLSIFDFGV